MTLRGVQLRTETPMPLLNPLPPDRPCARRRPAVDAATLAAAAPIVEAVRTGGAAALRAFAAEHDALHHDAPLVIGRDGMQRAFDSLGGTEQDLLLRVADRIRGFAEAQRRALQDVCVPVPGGVAGHRIEPIWCAGCYAPGGRHPLPSSVLMTAVTARVAGVRSVWLASPHPARITLAAAHVAGADQLLAAGGAHAVAALAFGAGPVPACDVVVGPGNRWVTAAKQLVSGSVGIDMLAGPSELVVLADGSADPERIAADLLAQAEHDDDAVPILISIGPALVPRVEAELARQLTSLPTAATARRALANGGVLVCTDLAEAARACDALAPEHVQVMTREPHVAAAALHRHGTLFLGGAAEVLGDYGAGPNHVLPTGGTARFTAGLSVFTFLRARTWLDLQDTASAAVLARDAAALARLEGLEGHARAAELRAR